MDAKGKAPLDNRDAPDADRARRFAEIERQRGETVGAKERAMHQRPREETPRRAEHYAEIERGRNV